MGRKSLEIISLHGYKIEDLVDIKNSTNSKYCRIVLTVVTMRYYGYSNSDIIAATRLNKPSIVSHIKDWNAHGMESTKDNRGGSESKLEPETVDDLIYVVINKSPVDFEFTSHTWTIELLSLYIERTYGIKVSAQTVRVTLHANKISYKRSQPKPTKADKDEQEAFKKTLEILDTLESSPNVVVYALDETKVRVESNNRLSWSPIGNPPILEKMLLMTALIL